MTGTPGKLVRKNGIIQRNSTGKLERFGASGECACCGGEQTYSTCILGSGTVFRLPTTGTRVETVHSNHSLTIEKTSTSDEYNFTLINTASSTIIWQRNNWSAAEIDCHTFEATNGTEFNLGKSSCDFICSMVNECETNNEPIDILFSNGNTVDNGNRSAKSGSIFENSTFTTPEPVSANHNIGGGVSSGSGPGGFEVAGIVISVTSFASLGTINNPKLRATVTERNGIVVHSEIQDLTDWSSITGGGGSINLAVESSSSPDASGLFDVSVSASGSYNLRGRDVDDNPTNTSITIPGMSFTSKSASTCLYFNASPTVNWSSPFGGGPVDSYTLRIRGV